MYPELFIPIALFVLLDARSFRCPGARSTAAMDARTIHSVAELYAVGHPNEPCPTLQALIDHKEIDGSSMRTDPWGRPYRIECTSDDVRVR